MIVCIAVIGKQNQPLFLHTGKEDVGFKFHFMVHTSLDVVEEKVSSLGKQTADSRECYLGQLYPIEEYRAFGYLTNTKTKFIIIVDDTISRDTDIREMFKAVSDAYIKCVLNPFYVPDSKITSKKFQTAIEAIIAQSSRIPSL